MDKLLFASRADTAHIVSSSRVSFPAKYIEQGVSSVKTITWDDMEGIVLCFLLVEHDLISSNSFLPWLGGQ